MSNTALFLVPALIWGSTWHAITWQLGVVAPEVSVTYRFAAASLLLAAGLHRDAPVAALFRCATTRSSPGVGLLMICDQLQLHLLGRAHRRVGTRRGRLFDDRVHDADRHARRVRRPDAAAAPRRRRARGDRRRAPVPAGARCGGRQGGSTAYGVALVLAATLACAVGNLIAVRNHNAGIPTIQGTAWTMIYGTLFAAAFAHGQRRSVDFRREAGVRRVARLSRGVRQRRGLRRVLRAAEARRRGPVVVHQRRDAGDRASCCRRCSKATGGRRSPRWASCWPSSACSRCAATRAMQCASSRPS